MMTKYDTRRTDVGDDRRWKLAGCRRRTVVAAEDKTIIRTDNVESAAKYSVQWVQWVLWMPGATPPFKFLS